MKTPARFRLPGMIRYAVGLALLYLCSRMPSSADSTVQALHGLAGILGACGVVWGLADTLPAFTAKEVAEARAEDLEFANRQRELEADRLHAEALERWKVHREYLHTEPV
jgi:hypothetical protein